jgi:hypothetical protein
VLGLGSTVAISIFAVQMLKYAQQDNHAEIPERPVEIFVLWFVIQLIFVAPSARAIRMWKSNGSQITGRIHQINKIFATLGARQQYLFSSGAARIVFLLLDF